MLNPGADPSPSPTGSSRVAAAMLRDCGRCVLTALFGKAEQENMQRRSGNNPTRRIVDADVLTQGQREATAARVRYVGSGHHKRRPADYGFERTNPRPTKSLCDASRTIRLAEANGLLTAGISKGMTSRLLENGLPKFVWSVSNAGEAFEAKAHPNTPGEYHGYPLEPEDDMRRRVLDAWKQR